MLAVAVHALLLASRSAAPGEPDGSSDAARSEPSSAAPGEPDGSPDAARSEPCAWNGSAPCAGNASGPVPVPTQRLVWHRSGDAPPPYGNASDLVAQPTLVHANATTAGRRCGILWHYHVPKCAGTSFLGYLRNKHSKGELAGLVDVTSLHSVIHFDTQVGPRLDAFALGGTGLLAVHHHHRGPGLHTLKPRLDRYRSQLQARGCDLYLVTMLRDPFERTASALAYNLPDGLVWGTAGQRTAYWNHELDHNVLYDNMQVRYVLNNHPDVPPGYPMAVVNDVAVNRAASILNSFAVVGFTERYDDFVSSVALVVGLAPQPPLPRSNVTPKQRRLDAAQMAASTRDRVTQRIMKDRLLVDRMRR